MACRSGCKTKNHSSYAECLRSAGVRVAYTDSANGWDYSKQRRWDNELQRYRDLESQGMEPLGTTHADMDKTEKYVEAYTNLEG